MQNAKPTNDAALAISPQSLVSSPQPLLLTLTLKHELPVPLEAEVLTPDQVADLPLAEVRGLPVYLGKRKSRLDDFFEIDGEPSDELVIHAEGQRIKSIGRGMTRGRVTIHGNAGMHLGAQMSGGIIEIFGNASDWVGGEMSGGLIHVHGNAGGQVGAAYRGSLSGMRGGAIIVDGSAGMEIGMRMRRGTIVIGGPVKDFAGLQMKGGSLFLLSGAELRTGAWMSRGTIVSLAPLRLLPTFSYACTYQPPFLRIYARQLAGLGISIPHDGVTGNYRRFTGDTSVPGKGELLLWQSTE